MPKNLIPTLSRTAIYDACLARSVANVATVLACIFVTALAKPAEIPTLAIVNGSVERSEDAPSVPAAFEFLPGDYLYFDFRITGFQRKPAGAGDTFSLSLQYRITPQDLNGVALAMPVEDAIAGDIHNEDKNWAPKRRTSFLIPSFVASGNYRVHVVVKDLVAGVESAQDYPFKIGGTRVPAATAIQADSFEFLRSMDDAKPVEIPAFRPGDTVYARFMMVGFKVESGNKYRLSYGIKVLRPDGKTFLDEPKAAQIASDSFYPAQFVPGELQITTPPNSMRGQYRITLTVRDLVTNQTSDSRQLFSIE